MDSAPHREFRWRFCDDGIGEQWSRWHVSSGPCAACCCGGGPADGEHREPAEHYHDGFLEVGHSYCDPSDSDQYHQMEWRPLTDDGRRSDQATNRIGDTEWH